MPVHNHPHLYKRVNLAKNGGEHFVYRCMKENCSHFVVPDLAVGKLAECWICHKPFTIHPKHVTLKGRHLVKPHCDDCTKPVHNKKKENKDALDSLMKDLTSMFGD